jgi:hypothetical protein
MKKIFYLFCLITCVGCKDLLVGVGLKKRCYTCTTVFVSPRASNVVKEICGDKDKESYRKAATGNVGGAIVQTTCTEK